MTAHISNPAGTRSAFGNTSECGPTSTMPAKNPNAAMTTYAAKNTITLKIHFRTLGFFCYEDKRPASKIFCTVYIRAGV
jgi:hypothetical protein